MVERALLTLLLSIVVAAGCATPDRETANTEEVPLENGSFTADLNGFEIHYEVHGRGPVVMTVPNSWGITVAGLRAVFGPMEERLTMVYFDPRGMGGSAPIQQDSDMGLAAVRADFQALREHLGLEKVHAIGWSNGAVNLVQLAAERPETLLSAVFMHGLASNGEEDNQDFAARYSGVMAAYEEFMEKVQNPDLSDGDKDQMLKDLWLTHFFPMSCADKESAAEIVQNLFSGSNFSWRHASYSQQEVSTFDMREQLRRITVPSLILAGRHDMIPLAKSEELDQGLPDSTLVVFEKSGHFSSAEEPEKFNSVVFDFLGVGD